MRMRSAVPAALLVALLAAVPAAHAVDASLPSLPALPVSQAGGYTVLRLQVPLSGAGGALQQQVQGGVLDVKVTPRALAGPGGSVGADVFVVDASILTPQGRLPLPSMVIDPADEGLPSPSGDELADLSDQAADLQAQLLALAGQLDALPSAPPAPGAPGAPDDPGLSEASDEAMALVQEAAWVQALAEAAGSEAQAGAAAETAIAQALLLRIVASAGLLVDDLSDLAAHFGASGPPETPEAPQPTAPQPTAPETPAIPDASSLTPSTTPSAPPSSTPSLATEPPSTPTADEAQAAAEAAIADAQAQAEGVLAQAKATQAAVEALAAGPAAQAAGKLAEAQAALDGAKVAAEEALLALGDPGDPGSGDAQAALAALQQAVLSGPAGEAAAGAQAALDDAQAHLAWLSGWAGAAAEDAGLAGVAGAASDAAAAADQASASAQSIAQLVADAAGAHSPPEAQAALAEAKAKLDEAQRQAADAQAAVEAALASLGDVPGGLEGLDPLGGAPGVPSDPGVPGPDGLPVSTDVGDPEHRLAVCLLGDAGQVCSEYATPDTPDQGTVTVLVAIPDVLTQSVSIPPDLPPVDPGSPPGVGVPGVPGAGVPDLGGGSSPPPSDESGSSSSSSFEPSSGDGSPADSSSSSSAGSPLDLPGDGSDSSSSSSSAPAAKAVLAIEAPAAASMGEGEQVVLDVTIRNSGNAADDVSITAQGDAPVAFDTPQESLHVGPGESRAAQVRLTPTSAGSGRLTLIATGESGGTVAHDVAVTVQAKAPAPARIEASLEPSAVDAKVGQATLLTIRIVNGGAAADVVQAVASGSSVMSIEPDRIEVALGPGESAVRQVRVVPLSEGHAVLSLHLTSQKGLDVTPVASFASSDAGAASHGGSDGSEGAGSGDDKGSGSKGSPAVAFPLLAAGLGAAAVAMLRRRRA